MVGEKSLCVLRGIDHNGQPCDVSIGSLQCELVSELTRATVRGSVERGGQSQYEICYQPTIKGIHQLHINLDDQHIKGSPFSVAAHLPVTKLDVPILAIDDVKAPFGVALNRSGEVVVSELDGLCVFVSIFSPGGEKLRSFRMFGTVRGKFDCPRSIAVDGKGNILVANSNSHCIQQFTGEGKFITSVGTLGKGPLKFDNPRGIAVNNKVYVIDKSHPVQVLNSDLTSLPLANSVVVRVNSIHLISPVTALGWCMLSIVITIASRSSRLRGGS